MTPEERAEKIVLIGYKDTDALVQHVRKQAAAAIRAAVEDAAQLADGVAAMYERNGPQGRYTADYRDGAKEAARHVAHLIRGGSE
jgi:hypothetical protein